MRRTRFRLVEGVEGVCYKELLQSRDIEMDNGGCCTTSWHSLSLLSLRRTRESKSTANAIARAYRQLANDYRYQISRNALSYALAPARRWRTSLFLPGALATAY